VVDSSWVSSGLKVVLTSPESHPVLLERVRMSFWLFSGCKIEFDRAMWKDPAIVRWALD
jgi:hypothetical protein